MRYPIAIAFLAACGTPATTPAPVAPPIAARPPVATAAPAPLVVPTSCEDERYVWLNAKTAAGTSFLIVSCRAGKPRLYDPQADVDAEISLAAWAQMWSTLEALKFTSLPASCTGAAPGAESWRVDIRYSKPSIWFFDCAAVSALTAELQPIVTAVQTAIATAGPRTPVVVKTLVEDLDGDGKPEEIKIGESSVTIGALRAPIDSVVRTEASHGWEARVIDLDKRDRARELVLVNTEAGDRNDSEIWLIYSLTAKHGLQVSEPISGAKVKGNGKLVLVGPAGCGQTATTVWQLRDGNVVKLSTKIVGPAGMTNCAAD